MKRYLLPLLFCASQLQAQPVLVKDIWPGPKDCIAYGFTEYNNKLIFAASDSIHGFELWEADGTNANIVDDLYPGRGSSLGIGSTNQKCTINGELYFAADADGTGSELYKWDGINKPIKVVDLNINSSLGSWPSYLCSLNGKAYFFAIDNFSQWHLYVHDPVTAITDRVSDIDPNYFQDGFGNDMKIINDELYFSSYYTDNTGQNTMQVFKYNPTTKTLTRSGDISTYSYPYSFKYLNGIIYFMNPVSGGTNNLWSWDGIHQAKKANELLYTSNIEVYGGKVYGNAAFFEYGPYAMFGYDPANKTNKGLEVVGFTSPTMVTYVNKLFYCQNNQLWAYNDIINESLPANFGTRLNGRYMAVAGGILYLTGITDAHGEELYAYYEAPASVNTLPQQYDISIYPNPSTGSWTFNFTSLRENDLQLIVTDIAGRVISKQSITSNIITASATTAGSYVYYVTDAKGIALQSGKLQRL